MQRTDSVEYSGSERKPKPKSSSDEMCDQCNNKKNDRNVVLPPWA